MNRTIALVLLLCGIILFVGSCAPWGYAAYRSLLAQPCASTPITPAGTSILSVVPGKAVRVAIRGRVTSQSVQEKHKGASSGSVEYVARYRFPVTVDVWDEAGARLLHRDMSISWDSGMRSTSDKSVSSTGGNLMVRTYFPRFTAPVSGHIRVKAKVGNDDTYPARFSSGDIEIFDNLINPTPYVLSGLAAFAFGIILSFIGFVYLLSSAAAMPATAGVSPAGPAGAHSVRQHAALCHASGLLGYIVPFGSVIAPLVLWLVWRDEDLYVFDQGCEALNFQISVLLYALLSILLMVVFIGFLLIPGVVLFQLILTIQATVRASSGEEFRYPLTIRFMSNGVRPLVK